ncbi:putative RNA helicase [Lentisphaera araneosa HTCC2155]|uniref:Putative RNA helicase n=1 Tax=Lentisphaera araneosa HTCC2155 TaxID=313628 RepID=A6DRD9_9BACT|nr:DEAD/DEAH box helicase [Lentisphaera araneosa]EDM25749.1 putative RNA helicase [Lentisphaera araneosa HTCC2155]
MLSLNQAIEIKESILAYLKATFNFQDKEVHQAFYDFINNTSEGLFKGPYLSLKLPFVKAGKQEQESIPLSIKPDWLAYDHQVKSWHRLSTANRKAQPTIITTGTGSGKTESFMYPVLDYCYRNLSRQGIKVIILYPMNALATDQAKRLAEAIYEDDRLKGKVTAGLFIGEGKDAGKYPKTMGADHIIENRESILASPPDILLTNFKMLDYALMKSNYNDLWLGNYKDSSLLQFLVLDELHTYDGAQGTDVANLIRRLKLKLSIPEDHLCPVGTSATIGSGEEAPKLLSDYASKIFGETIDPDCLITENRIQTEDFFEDDEKLDPFKPRTAILRDVKPQTGEGYDKYIERQIGFWQMSRDRLAEDLSSLKIVKDLVSVVNQDKGIHTLDTIVRNLSNLNENFRTVPQWDDQLQFNPKENIVLSLFSLISEAKVIDPQNGRKSPFLYTQTQLWIRELSGLLRTMSEKPQFTWKADTNPNENLSLPPWFCRDCGASGWLGIKHDNKERFEQDVQDVYTKFFANHKHIYFANRTSEFSMLDAVSVGYEPDDTFKKYVSNSSLLLHSQEDETRTDITAFRKLNRDGYNEHICPECNTRNTVSIIGTRIATLSSITVSQVLATDLDEQDEQQRKVLAFTNSVQDAAHQAGFVEARNYRFTFRSSLQQVINNLDKTVSLKELSDEFRTHWKESADGTGKSPLDAYYYRFYPTDYIGKSSPEDYKDKNDYESHFIKEFDERVSWELYSEFAYNAQIGRTLEKTSSSAVHFALEDLESVWDLMEPWLKENEPSGTIEKKLFLLFVELLLHRVRIRGAVSHDFLSKFRDGDLKLWDLNWMKDGRHFLNKNFGPRTRIPKLLTFKSESRGILDSTFAKKSNWFHQYYKKSFIMASSHQDMVNEFYEQLILSLEKSGIMDKSNCEEKLNFGLNPAKVFVNNKAKTYECSTCAHVVITSQEDHDLSNGKCLVYRCTGVYQINESAVQDNYYQLVYNRERSPRIYAADHTGLLERKAREDLEIDFKTRPNFNSKNAMVATSTLEMGIDIGSLNTAINNSIPPMPSNFLQRVGRAGRSTGSALIVNFAKSQAHDLFYYAEPLDMMAGEVSTPGCYIEAKEILKRHFFAYCIDSWAKEDPKNHHIPSNINYLKIETTDLFAPEFFINKIINFVKINEMALFESFKAGYKNDVEDSVFQHLRYELNNDAFYQFYKKIFVNLKDEIKKIQVIRKEIDERIKELKLGKEDPERIELENEKKNLGGIIRSIKNRNTLEHLTNVGALPNYAFPETGVTLTAKVLGNQAVGSTKTPLNKDFEIVRSASQALKEFAPDNHFYSQGYKFRVTGINTFDWSDKSNLHKKRFCSNCDHIELAETATKGACPKCNHESWASSSNVHTYAKLLSVKSFNNQSDACINDSSDDRNNLAYNVLQHFSFKDTSGAYAMKEIPFGIEFFKEVTITEENLGRKDVLDPRKVKINDFEAAAHGFITCKHCGKSSSNVRQKINGQDYKFHYGYCKYKDKVYAGQSDDVFEEVFFFREIQTEALKILLPVQELNSDAEIKMFQAGIELGLKKYFKGNPQHVRLSIYREYNHVTTKFDKYLVLYDAIPGGTGYLEKLFNANAFSKLLDNAYTEIKNCSCQFDDQDGCYRCIYSYSNQYYHKELSREQAEKRFYEIIRRSDDWEEQPAGLGNLTNTGNIEESELEVRFIRSLKKMAQKNESWQMDEVNDDGTISYTMNYSDSKKNLHFYIRPQVNLGRADGVEFHTRSDFLFICTHCEVNGEVMEDKSSLPRIAVELDGYQWHASGAHNRFEKDWEKRRAVSKSANHYSWSLTWDDVELFDTYLSDEETSNCNDSLNQKLLTNKGFQKTRSTLLKAVKRESGAVKQYENNFVRFLETLKSIEVLNSLRNNNSLYLSFFHEKLFTPSFPPAEIHESLANKTMNNYCVENKTLDGLIPLSVVEPNELFDLNMAVNIQKSELFADLTLKDTDSIDKEQWNEFWAIYNLIQFFDYEERGTLEEIADIEIEIDEILDAYDPELHPIILNIFKAGYLKSEEDEIKLNSLLDDNGDELAGAELIIEHKKLVYKPYSDEDEATFTQHGYTCINLKSLRGIEL